MKKPSILKEEVLHYLNEEWNDSLRVYGEGLWVTTRALQLKLRDRGVLISWPTLNIRIQALSKLGSIEKIRTSNGDCWKPSEEGFKI